MPWFGFFKYMFYIISLSIVLRLNEFSNWICITKGAIWSHLWEVNKKSRSCNWNHFVFSVKTINVREPTHDIDYIECAGPSLNWGRNLRTCVELMWRNKMQIYVYVPSGKFSTHRVKAWAPWQPFIIAPPTILAWINNSVNYKERDEITWCVIFFIGRFASWKDLQFFIWEVSAFKHSIRLQYMSYRSPLLEIPDTVK